MTDTAEQRELTGRALFDEVFLTDAIVTDRAPGLSTATSGRPEHRRREDERSVSVPPQACRRGVMRQTTASGSHGV